MVDAAGPMLPRAAAHAVARQAEAEWFGSPPHRWAISGPRAEGFAAKPRDPRPRDLERGRQALVGAFVPARRAMHVDPASALRA